MLYLGPGKYGYKIHVQDTNGNPLPGLIVNGIITNEGNPCVTDANGDCIGINDSENVTVSISSPWDDLMSSGDVQITSTGFVTSKTISLDENISIENKTPVPSAKTFILSPYTTVTDIDLTVVGGGGAGGSTSASFGGGQCGGGGGGGGGVNTITAHPVSPLDAIKLYIGAGGRASTSIPYGGDGGTGGTTYATKNGSTICTVAGGGGGKRDDSGSNGGSLGGPGNGAGGAGTRYLNGWQGPQPGNPGTGYVFNDATLGLAGGGGGGGGNGNTATMQGGAPYGGAGGTYGYHGSSGTGAGGGGGGAGGNSTQQDFFHVGGDGGSGIAYIRFNRRR